MSKKIIRENSGMVSGINAIVDTIKVTLGPKGKCVAIQQSFGGPEITRDGATVAKGISFKDPEMSMGAELVKAASVNTEEQAGDSTSTTAVLLQEFVKAGLRLAQDREVNMNEVKAGMEKAIEEVKEYLAKNSIPVEGDLEKIRKVATISANNDPAVGNLIVEAMKEVGLEGVITADYSSGLDTTIEVTQGFKVERGWASPHFVNNASDGKCTLEDPVVLVVGERLSTIPPLAPILEAVAKQDRSLLIVADEVDEVVLNMLAFNVLQGALRCCVIKGIDFGDARKNIMEDIAISVGAQFVCPEHDITLSKVTLDMLGTAEKVIVSKGSTIIYKGGGDPGNIKGRLEILKDRLKDPSTSQYEKTKFQTRISGLSGGVAVIKAGGASETERKNRKATIEDAILASQSALSEGIVAGGGFTLIKASEDLLATSNTNFQGQEVLGRNLVLEGIKVITKTIAENYGISGDVVLNEVARLGQGFNAKTGKYCNLLEEGVLDSTKSLRVALENSCSAAGMALLTAAVVIDEETGDSAKL